jgi:hypothetical protein
MRFLLPFVHGSLLRHAVSRESEEAAWDMADLPFEVDMNQTVHAFLADLAPARQKPLMFLHIHKAGGTMLCRFARQAEVVVRPEDNCNWKGQDDYHTSGQPNLHKTCADRLLFFRQNGFTYGQIEREMGDEEMCADFDYAVLLREPMALMSSLWNYELWYAWKGWGSTKEEHKDPAGFLRGTVDSHCSVTPTTSQGDAFWKFFDNFQTRFLANAFDVPAGKLDDTHAAKAHARLQEHKVNVKLLEEMPIQGAAFFSQLGWPDNFASHLHEKSNSLDGFQDKFVRKQFSESDAAYLRELNKYDYALYDRYRSTQQ